MENTDKNHHEKYKFGIFYPSHIHSIGSPKDLLAFFYAIELVTNQPEVKFPFFLSLRRKPVFGADMLQLFEEIKVLHRKMKDTPLTRNVVLNLGLSPTETLLKTDAPNLAVMFEDVFKVLADASEWVKLDIDEFGMSCIEDDSIRLGPIEPLIPSRLFQELPASAFDDNDPPLWLRDEIFDEAFYRGKI